MTGRARPKRRRGRFAGLLAVLGILAIIVPLAIGGFYAYRAISAHFFPADYSGAGTGNVTVQIRPGDTATTVGDRLYALGVVASARAFVNAAEHSQKGNALQPGFYRMHKHMKATLAFNLLLKPSSRIQVKVTIPEGLRVVADHRRARPRLGHPVQRVQAGAAQHRRARPAVLRARQSRGLPVPRDLRHPAGHERD